MIKKKADGVGVDAGMIMVADVDYAAIDSINEDSHIFEIPNGEYLIHWSIPNTYSGEIEGLEKLRVTGGKIIVTDPCYVIRKDWDGWLDSTNYGKNINTNHAFIIDSMGGDGTFDVFLSLKGEKVAK